MRKTISVLLLCLTFILSCPSTALAANATTSGSTVVTIDGVDYYIDTVITEWSADTESNRAAASNTKTASKTTYIKDSSQNVLWYVSITATFSYDGTTAACTSCSPHATAQDSQWSIKSSSASKSGNSATATATAVRSLSFGLVQESTKSVTISCSPTGEIF